MLYKLKAVGLAFAASLALTAVATSTASAAEGMHFHAPSAPTVGTAHQTAPHVFKTGAGEISCGASTYEGTQGPVTSTTLTVTGTFTNCIAFGFANTHINMNGCDFEFTTPTTRMSSTTYTLAPPHVQCTPESNTIRITPTDPFFGLSVCTVTIPDQTPTEGHVIARNEGSGTTRDVHVNATVDGIHYTVDGGGGLCGTTGTTHSDGEYLGESTLKGFNDNNSNSDTSHNNVQEPLEITGGTIH